MRAAGCGGKLRTETAVLVFAAACLSGCGGGSAVVPPPPPTPPITVTVVGPSDTLNTGARSSSLPPLTMPRTTRSTGP